MTTANRPKAKVGAAVGNSESMATYQRFTKTNREFNNTQTSKRLKERATQLMTPKLRLENGDKVVFV